MRSLLALTLVSASLLLPTALSGHIDTAVMVPVPRGGGVVEFNYVQKGTGNPGGAGLQVDFGDGTFACIPPPLDHTQPAGIYLADLYNFGCGGPVVGTFSYTVYHPLAPYGLGTLLYETVVTFDHVYTAPGLYAGSWTSCCAPVGSPFLAAAV